VSESIVGGVDDVVTQGRHPQRDDWIMVDEDWYKPHRPPVPTRQPTPGERIWSLRKNGHHVDCELPFHGDPYGWGAQFLERGEILASRGGFTLRTLAVQWAQAERQAIEGRPCAHCRGAGWMCDARSPGSGVPPPGVRPRATLLPRRLILVPAAVSCKGCWELKSRLQIGTGSGWWRAAPT
jgi:hypothetical protein